jgi:transposase
LKRSKEEEWADAIARYKELGTHGDPASVVRALSLAEPNKRAPVSVWIAWHRAQAECWSRLAERDPMFVENDQLIGGYHREEIRRLGAEGRLGR